MKQLFITILLFFSVQAFAEGESVRPLLNFRDWKAEKIQSVQGKITSLKTQIETVRKIESKSRAAILMGYYTRSLNQEKWNLEVATDLNITDYVVLYVVHHPSQEKFKGAAALLTPAEVAQLIEAYSHNIGAAAGPAATVSSSSSSSLLGPSRTAERQ